MFQSLVDWWYRDALRRGMFWLAVWITVVGLPGSMLIGLVRGTMCLPW